MKRIFTTVTAAVVALGFSLITAPAGAAGPAADPEAVINDLKANGYRVIITKVGSAHPSRCTVASVSRQSPVWDRQPARGIRNQPTSIPTVTRKIAHVTLAC